MRPSTAAASSNVTRAPQSVAITGLGAVCCAGVGVERLWRAALESRVSAEWLEQPVAGQWIAVCRAPSPVVNGMRSSDFARLERFAQLGAAAGEQAWDDAQMRDSGIDPRRIAVITGTSRGPVAHPSLPAEPSRLRPTAAVYGSASSLTGVVAGLIGARGPSMTISATCASSAVAIGVAAMQITSGACDVALVIGADATLHPQFLAELQATGVLGTGNDPTRVCRPFARGRTGITIGEAAAGLVLEAPHLARARGAHIRAELTGWSSTCDAGRRSGMSDDARGILEALETALGRAAVSSDEIDAVHVHGTGTLIGDAAEGMVLKRLFGNRTVPIPLTSTKPVTGHCLGASGALQAVMNVRALQEQRLPPTAAGHPPDPECGVELWADAPRHGSLRTILSHSAGFWGNHAGLVYRRV